jgi:CrcB protein
MKTVFLIGVLGAAGVLTRYGIDRWLGDTGSPFPLSTFLINALGSFLIGAVYVAGVEKGLIGRDISIALMAGFLGGFTTFSAYSLQTILLLKDQHLVAALSYMAVTPVVAVFSALGGIAASRGVL